MINYREAFLTFRKRPTAYVEVANGDHAPCLGVGAAIFYLKDKLVLLPDVLYVPSLTNCLLSVPRLREHHPDCEFVSLRASHLQFPGFTVPVNDADECTVSIRFLPYIPCPLPSLDFNVFGTDKIPISAGTAAPVTTRSMTRPCHIEDCSQAPAQPVERSASLPPSPPDQSSSVPPRPKPTTSTPGDRPGLPVYFKQFSSSPKQTRLTTQQLHSYLGCRSLKNWKSLDDFAQPTVSVTEMGEKEIELGDVVNLKAARKNNVPVPRPDKFLDVLHADLYYGDCSSIGGIRYVLMLVDRATRFTYAIGIKSLVQEDIIKGLMKFKLDMGGLPQRLYTDFDHRLLSGKTEIYLNQNDCQVLGSPANRQHRSGLVERSWQTIMNMACSYLHTRQMPRVYWW